MKFLPKKIVGIDFHDYAAQIVELKMVNETISLEAYNRAIIPPDVIVEGEIVKEEELKSILVSLFKSANPYPIESRNVAVIFPSAKIFTHIFKFPLTLNHDEIKKALPYEAELVIPFSIEDVYYDFTVVAKDLKNKKHASQYVLFVAVIKTVADQYTRVLQAVGLTPFLFGADVEALQYGIGKQLDPKKTNMIIDVNTLSVNYLVMKNGYVKHFFSATKGGKFLLNSLSKEFQTDENIILEQKEKGELDSKYFPEITKFLDTVLKIGSKIGEEHKVTDISFTGEFVNLPGFSESVKKFFPGQTVSLGDPGKALRIDPQHLKPVEAKSYVPYSTYFISAIGVALRGLLSGSTSGLNLLPQNLRESFSNKKHAIFVTIFSVLMCAFSLFIATFLFFQHQELIYERRGWEVKKAEVEKLLYGTRYQEIRDAINSFNKEVGELAAIDTSLYSVPTMLNNVYSLLPPGITVTEIFYDDEKLTLEISGIAETRESLLATHQKFKEAEFVEEVIAPISNYDEKVKISFKIKLKLNFNKLPKYGSSAGA